MKEKDFRGFVTKRPLGAHAGWFTTVSGRAGGQRTAMFRRQLGPYRHSLCRDVMRFDMRREGTACSLIRQARPRDSLVIVTRALTSNSVMRDRFEVDGEIRAHAVTEHRARRARVV
jgi:hypothetical protein